MLCQERRRGGDLRRGILGLEIGEHVARLVFVGRRAAERRQHVDRKRQKAFKRDTARDVLDVRIEPAVFMDDDHRRTLGFAPEPRQIAADPRAGGVVRRRFDDQPRIVGRNGCRACVIVLQ